MGGIYLPREDSYLIQKHVKAHVKGKVLDMGTGSGILAKTALEHTEDVIACDVDKTAVKFATEQGVNVIHSDLFSNLAIKTDKDRFSLIMFNPPYLPNEPGAKDVALDGGKNGYETIGRFLDSANPFLHENGKILLLFSSLTKKQKIDEYIERNCFSSKLIDREKLAFEELYVYSIEKTKLLKKLERIGIKNISYFTKGHRGYLYKGLLKNKEVMIKAKNPKSDATGRIRHEGLWLRKLNKKRIGPKIIKSTNDFFIYNYVPGDFIADAVKKNKKPAIKKVLKKIFDQLYILDSMGINKEEMHHPLKHIIVDDKLKVTMIDFERINKTKKPKNITQFCQFISHSEMNKTLAKKGIKIKTEKMTELAKEYKRDPTRKNYLAILKLVTK